MLGIILMVVGGVLFIVSLIHWMFTVERRLDGLEAHLGKR